MTVIGRSGVQGYCFAAANASVAMAKSIAVAIVTSLRM